MKMLTLRVGGSETLGSVTGASRTATGIGVSTEVVAAVGVYVSVAETAGDPSGGRATTAS